MQRNFMKIDISQSFKHNTIYLNIYTQINNKIKLINKNKTIINSKKTTQLLMRRNKEERVRFKR